MVSSEGTTRQYDFPRAKIEASSRGVKWVRACLDDLQLRYVESGIHTFVQDYPAIGTDSFCVFPNGTFKDFNGGDQGDLVALCGLVRSCSPMDGLKWLYGRLGWGPDVNGQRLSDAQLMARDAEARRLREAADAKREAAADEYSDKLASRYLALPFGLGTIVQTYFEASRGIIYGPDGTDHLTRTLRYQADAVFKYPDGGEELLPAMLAPFYDLKMTGRLVGLHRTYLKLDGSSKAWCGLNEKGKPLPVKKMLGRKGIIPLHKGEGNLSAKEALKRGHTGDLVICEGIEDGETVHYYQPGYRIWAAGDKDNMARIVWPDFASRVMLIADNDGSTPEEQEANFAKVEKRWREMAQGRPLEVRRSLNGKDFNDWHTQND